MTLSVLVVLSITGAGQAGPDQSRPATRGNEAVDYCLLRAGQPDSISLEAVQQVVRDISMYAVNDDSRVELPLQKGPLLMHLDTTQGYSDGTLWIWGSPGRPQAVLSLSAWENRNWVHEFISLSAGRLEAHVGGGLRWSPQRPGWKPQRFPHAPSPAQTERGRLRQVKALSRRFTAFEYYPEWDPHHPGERYELRLVPQAVYRYGESAGGTLEGALFVIAKDTNPELLLVIELAQPGKTAAAWRYNCSPVTIAGLSLKLDGKDVWGRKPILYQSTKTVDPYRIYDRPITRTIE